MKNKCINFKDPIYQKLLSNSGLTPLELTFRIEKYQEQYGDDLFPTLEFLMTGNEAFNKVLEILSPKKRYDNTYELSHEKIKNIAEEQGLINSGSSVLFQELNNIYKNIKIEKIKDGSRNKFNYTIFKIDKIPTIYDDIKNKSNLTTSQLLSVLEYDNIIKEEPKQSLHKIGDWNVYKDEDEYVVIKGEYKNTHLNRFDSKNEAIIEAGELFKNDDSLTTNVYNTIIKKGKQIFDEIDRKKKFTFKIDSKDIKLNSFDLYNIEYPNFKLSDKIQTPYSISSSGNIIKSNLSRAEFFSHIEGKTKYYKTVNDLLSQQGYNIDKIQQILNDNSKIMNYMLLKIKYFENNPEEYQKFISTANSSAKAPYDVNASIYALEFLQNGNRIKLNIENNITNTGNYIILKVDDNKSSFKQIGKKETNNQSILNLLKNISDNYGINYELITTDEIKSNWNDKIQLAETKKAFIYDGKIYVNLDIATLAEPIHELTHLFLGAMKQKNPSLYNEYLNKVYELPDYKERAKRYEYLTESDKNEEIFAEFFGDYLNSRITNKDTSNWIKKNNQLFNYLEYDTKRTIDEMINPDESITKETLSTIKDMNLQDVMNLFGTSIKEGNIAQVLDSGLSKMTREMRNIKSRLLKDEKLTEICY